MADAPGVTVFLGDCLDVLGEIPDGSVDAIVTDPPYGLGFMGKEWDDLPPGLPWARECLRVLKPGAFLLAFGGTRTWHRLAVAVDDAGFEMRDSIAWLYGSGFPKSLDVSKAIDKAAGATREVVGQRDRYLDGKTRQNLGDRNEVYGQGLTANGVADITSPATSAAQQWAGWGTALKPAFEPIVVARKPLPKGTTVAANVLAHGAGALNIDATRIEGRERTDYGLSTATRTHGGVYGTPTASADFDASKGRWPTNVVLDDHAAAELDADSGQLKAGNRPRVRNADENRTAYGEFAGQADLRSERMDSGGASRFFPTFRYQAKAPTRERPSYVRDDGTKVAHATVKPLDLMRWLVRLVTPPGGTVLEPFAGSGTTVEACLLEGFGCIAIERDPDSIPLIVQRTTRAQATLATVAPPLFDDEGVA